MDLQIQKGKSNLQMGYATCTSVKGNEIIKIWFCSSDAKRFESINIETKNFDVEERTKYKELDLSEFGEWYSDRKKIQWVTEIEGKGIESGTVTSP